MKTFLGGYDPQSCLLTIQGDQYLLGIPCCPMDAVTLPTDLVTKASCHPPLGLPIARRTLRSQVPTIHSVEMHRKIASGRVRRPQTRATSVALLRVSVLKRDNPIR